MSNIIPFRFENLQVRAIMRDNEPWFVATDVCEALEVQNVTQAVARLDTDERSMFNIGRQGDATIINESGIYSLILSSRKPEAKRFKKWVTGEVLPSIRKTGAYLHEGVTLDQLPPAIAKQFGGIIKSVIHKELETALRIALPALLHGEAAKQQTGLRHGRTAGQVWNDYKLQPSLRGASQWLSSRLVELGCQIDGGGRSESGGIPSKLFDPDKVERAMKEYGLLALSRQYVQQRCGQAPLFASKGMAELIEWQKGWALSQLRGG